MIFLRKPSILITVSRDSSRNVFLRRLAFKIVENSIINAADIFTPDSGTTYSDSIWMADGPSDEQFDCTRLDEKSRK